MTLAMARDMNMAMAMAMAMDISMAMALAMAYQHQIITNISLILTKNDNSFFSLVNKNVNTRSKSRIVEEFRCRTTRFEKSSLPYMAKLLNK